MYMYGVEREERKLQLIHQSHYPVTTLLLDIQTLKFIIIQFLMFDKCEHPRAINIITFACIS